MPLRVKLYTLEQENSQPTFFDHVRVEEGDCKVILRSSAKKYNKIFDWPFHYFVILCADSETTIAPKRCRVEEVATPVVSNDTHL